MTRVDLADPGFWASPNRDEGFAILRRDDPVSFHRESEFTGDPDGPGFWSLVRHEDVVGASRQPDLFSSAQGFDIVDLPQEVRHLYGSLPALDDPRHAELRGIVNRGFTPRAVARLRETVREVAEGVLDAVAERDGEVDFVEAVAAPFPLRVICHLLGVPEEDHPFMLECTNVILGSTDPEYGGSIAAADGAAADLCEYGIELARQRRGSDGGDLTTILGNAEVDGAPLADAELGAYFLLLLTAGNETTRTALTHGLLALCEHPEQMDAWRADVDGLAPTAIEEILRWASPVMHFRRTATRDVVLRGQEIAAGDKVVLWYVSANRDERAFERPDVFELRRTPNPHVAFGGGGAHFCLGASLARLELRVMFSLLFERFAELEVVGAPVRLHSPFVNGIKRLPVQFTPA
ncbi:MAG TPA: cytochrome P450 [Acidimicrobiales bacterium]|nr:cytochrome P450 [Acidimicrobiales bacterium]